VRVVVIGGTGLTGSKVVAILREYGYDVVAASRRRGVNTITGEGLCEALEGADVVLDVSNSPSLEGALALDFFERSTANILDAEVAAGVGHHVALSVVGAQRLQASGYCGAKHAQERLIKRSSIPWTIIQSTLFFEFIRTIADTAMDGGTVRLAPVLVEPIAVADVARVLAAVVAERPACATLEVAGPQQFRFDEFIRRGLAVDGDARRVVADRNARYFDAELHEHTLIPRDPVVLAQTRFDDWARSRRSMRCIPHRELIDELLTEHAQVSGDPFQLDAGHWAIHGIIPVAGDVILAKFESPAEARAAIEELWEIGA
jgi:uncharacterized protein YbjT (DUF2867 family)